MAIFNIVLNVQSSQANTQLGAFGRRLTETEKAANQMKRALAGAFAGFTVIETVKKFSQLSDVMTNARNRLGVVTDSTAQLADVQKKLFEVANRTRGSFETTADVYARFAQGTKTLGTSQKDLLLIVENLNKAVILGGSNQNEARQGLIQLSQAMALGKLRGQDLNSVLSQLPGVAKVLADSLHVTVGELKEMGRQGKLTNRDLVEAFTKPSPFLDKFKATVSTVQQALTVMQNKLIEFVGKLNDNTGIAKKFADAILLVANNLDKVTKAAIALGAAITVVLVQQAIPKLIAAYGALTLAMAANPFGVAVIAIGLLAAAFFLFQERIVGTEGHLNSFGKAMKKFSDFMKIVVIDIAKFFEFISNGVVGAAESITVFLLGFPDAFGDVFTQAFNKAGSSITKGIRDILTPIANVLGPDIEEAVANIHFDKVENAYKGNFANLGRRSKEAFIGSFDNHPISDFLKKQLLDARIGSDSVNGPGGGGDNPFAGFQATDNGFSDFVDIMQKKLPDKLGSGPETVPGFVHFDGIEKVNAHLNRTVKLAGDIKDAYDPVMAVLEQGFVTATQSIATFARTGKLELGSLFAQIHDGLAKILLQKLALAALGKAGLGDSGFGNFLTGLLTQGGKKKFATGGSFMVGGSGGTDSQTVAFRATPGERVSVQTPQQQQQVNVNTPLNVRIMNVVDQKSAALAALSGSEGERLIMNVIQSNPNSIRRLLA